MKTIRIPQKALHPNYDGYGGLEFYTSETDYSNGYHKSIELPKWMIGAIDKYAEAKAENAVDKRLREIRAALDIYTE